MDSTIIAGHLRQAREVTIILGAGASVRAGIPLAGELVDRINNKYLHCLSGLSEDERRSYGRVMAALSPGDRKELIQPLLEDSKVNWGHIALACIISKCSVSRVLTFNFDLVLERAASLMGMHLPVYDFAVAPTENIGGLATPAIIHLHGQSYGLRLMNSDAETLEHAQKLKPLLTDSLRNHVTIIAGYSGQADAALPLMTEAFNEQHHLIWLGHEKQPGKHLRDLLAKNYTTYVGGCDFDITMMEVGRELGCFPPEVFRNPPAHLLSELEDVAEFPVQSESEIDILTDTQKRLEAAASSWEEDTGGEGQSQQALLSGTELEVGDPEKLSEAERVARAWNLVNSGIRIRKKASSLMGSEATQLFQETYWKYAEAVRIKPDMHEAYFNWGNALVHEAKLLMDEAAFNKYGEASMKYAEAVRIKPDDHEALGNWAISLIWEASSLQGEERSKKLTEVKEKALLAQIHGGKEVFGLACVHALLGESDDALNVLEACLADGTLPSLTHLETDSDLDSLRDKPRFQALLEKLKETT